MALGRSNRSIGDGKGLVPGGSDKDQADEAFLRAAVRDLDQAQVELDPSLADEDIRQGEFWTRKTNVDGPHPSGKI